MPILIRSVSYEDVSSILEIERSSFSAPFSRDMFMGMIYAQPPFGAIAAEDKGRLIGYLFYTMVMDEMELLTIAVSERERGKGIGRLLMQQMIRNAGDFKAKKIFLEVRPSNIRAKRLYASFGFEQIGVRKGYYRDNNEDAIVMEKRLG